MKNGWRIGFALVSVAAASEKDNAIDVQINGSSQFEVLSYAEIVKNLKDLSARYPRIVQVYSAQERYGLDSPGTCSELVNQGQSERAAPCEQWFVHVTDHTTMDDDPERPEVFLSGCLHGNERVGPTTVVETATLLARAATCHISEDNSAKECDDEAFVNNPSAIPWLAHLVKTRSTVIMPTANAIGYFQSVREENGMDPNRDFPYQQASDKCMNTLTARALNEVWREHVFQLAVTFHGGMVGMAYEWGSLNHPHKKDKDQNWQDVSPDHAAQLETSQGLSMFAGSFSTDGEDFEAYPTGRMNELVYPVAGGMEDWSYAGSWDGKTTTCEPKTYGGYSARKTMYNSGTLRALNILVEASVRKNPRQETLGRRKGLFDPIPDVKNNGHISRNIRLSVMIIDLVQPYIQWIWPTETLYTAPKLFETPVLRTNATEEDGFKLPLRWTVGGCFRVDSTQLIWGTWPEDLQADETPDPAFWETLASSASEANRSPTLSGVGRWGTRVQATELEGFRDEPRSGVFEGVADLTELFQGHHEGEGSHSFAFVMAVATVDQAWAKQRRRAFPDVAPQSHYVNARTSAEWLEDNAGHIVRGHMHWVSPPLKIPLSTASKTPPSSFESSSKTFPAQQVPHESGNGLNGGLESEGANGYDDEYSHKRPPAPDVETQRDRRGRSLILIASFISFLGLALAWIVVNRGKLWTHGDRISQSRNSGTPRNEEERRRRSQDRWRVSPLSRRRSYELPVKGAGRGREGEVGLLLAPSDSPDRSLPRIETA